MSEIASGPVVQKPSYRIYSPAAVVWATVLGTVAAGGILLGLNYWRWGQKREAWTAVIGGFVAVAALIAAAMILPDSIPNAVYVVPQFIVASQLTKQLQGKQLDAHLAAGGKRASLWKAVGIGLMMLGVCGGVFLAWFFSTQGSLRMFTDTQQSVMVGNDHEVYYARGATREMAEQLGAALKEEGYFAEGHAVSVLLTGTGPTKEIGFVVGKEVWEDEKMVGVFKELVRAVAPSVGGLPVTLRFVDVNLVEKKRVQVE